jgi:hypothetical protein
MKILVAVHLIFGLIGILSGCVAMAGMLGRKRLAVWHGIFLASTLAASGTGFVFLPLYGFSSAQLVGVFSVVFLLLAVYGRYVQHLCGSWNQIYIVSTVAALFLNVLIAITQSFEHFQFLKRVAPTQNSPFFIILKWVLLMVFIGLGSALVIHSEEKKGTTLSVE